LTTDSDESAPTAVSQEPKLPNANEAARKHMLNEAPQKPIGT
jgi:hypothetical protein